MKNVDDVYALTPMQEVMLLHSAPTGGDDVLFHQFRYEWRGEVDAEAFEGAWQEVARHHPALRTAFAWKGLEAPVQVVRTEVQVPVERLDLTGGGGEAALAEWMEQDRRRGFDLTRAPLTRVLLAERAPDHWTVVWSSHHLVLDRWCIGLVLDDLAAAYEGEIAGRRGPRRAPGRFRDYVAWTIERRADGASETHWARTLAGARHAARTIATRRPERGPETWRGDLAPDTSEAVRAAAKAARATPGAAAQLAVALALSELAGHGDVVFGVTVAGRPPEVPGIEEAVGTFIGNVPSRPRLDPGSSIQGALRTIVRDAQTRSGHEWVAPTELHALAGLPADTPLFDVLFVHLAESSAAAPRGIEVTSTPGSVRSALPVTVGLGEDGGRLHLEVAVRPGFGVAGGAASLGERIARALEGVASNPLARLGDVARFTPAPAEAAAPRAARPRPTACAESRDSASSGRESESLATIRELVLDEARSLLGQPDLGLVDDFFDVGGDSLTAARMHANIEAGLGCRVPLVELFSAPTFGAMADQLHSGEWPLHDEVVRLLRRGGDRPPLVCLASPDVNAVGFANLARHVDPDLPVLLAQVTPSGEVTNRMALSDVPALARRSIESLEGTLADGPLRLLGMCDGALIAIEMARQLEAEGRPPAFVGVLDTFALGTLSWRFKLRRLGSRARYYRDRILQELVRRPDPSQGESCSELAAQAPPPPSTGPRLEGEARERQIRRLAEINAEWFARDTPRGLGEVERYGGTVTLFRIRHQPYWRVRDETLGWSRHAARVDVVDLEAHARSDRGRGRDERLANHLGLLREPDVAGTATALEAVLQDGTSAAPDLPRDAHADREREGARRA